MDVNPLRGPPPVARCRRCAGRANANTPGDGPAHLGARRGTASAQRSAQDAWRHAVPWLRAAAATSLSHQHCSFSLRLHLACRPLEAPRRPSRGRWQGQGLLVKTWGGAQIAANQRRDRQPSSGPMAGAGIALGCKRVIARVLIPVHPAGASTCLQHGVPCHRVGSRAAHGWRLGARHRVPVPVPRSPKSRSHCPRTEQARVRAASRSRMHTFLPSFLPPPFIPSFPRRLPPVWRLESSFLRIVTPPFPACYRPAPLPLRPPSDPPPLRPSAPPPLALTIDPSSPVPPSPRSSRPAFPVAPFSSYAGCCLGLSLASAWPSCRGVIVPVASLLYSLPFPLPR